MGTRIIERASFKVIGVELQTTTCDGRNLEAIPEFWNSFIQKGLAARIPHRTHPEVLMGMCADFANDGSFTYSIGAEVARIDEVPDGMVARTVPAAKYAVFTAKGKVPQSIQETICNIFSTGLSSLGLKHAGTEDFELYDERFTGGEDSEVDIYIPVTSA